MTNLENQITEVFASFDKDYLDSIPAKCEELQKRAKEIRDNYVTEMIDNPCYNPTDLCSPKKIDKNGGGAVFEAKKECGEFSLGSLSHFIEMTTKNAVKNQKARNQKIVKALQKHNIDSIDIPEAKITWGNDFETDVLIDDLVVTIKIIFAGGYNIQRGHFRTLVKVRKAK